MYPNSIHQYHFGANTLSKELPTKRKQLLASLLFCCIYSSQFAISKANDVTYHNISAELMSIQDAASFNVTAIYNGSDEEIELFLANTDVPRTNSASKCEAQLAVEAKSFSANFISKGIILIPEFYFDYKGSKRGLGDIVVNDQSLTQALIDAGYARDSTINQFPWCIDANTLNTSVWLNRILNVLASVIHVFVCSSAQQQKDYNWNPAMQCN